MVFNLLKNIRLISILIGCLISNFGFAKPLKDPTRPPGKAISAYKKVSGEPTWVLSSTLIAHGRRNATINGRIVTVGQTINSAKILSIQPNTVWLLHKKKRIRIKLLGRDIKDFSKHFTPPAAN